MSRPDFPFVNTGVDSLIGKKKTGIPAASSDRNTAEAQGVWGCERSWWGKRADPTLAACVGETKLFIPPAFARRRLAGTRMLLPCAGPATFALYGRTVNSAQNRKFETGRRIVDQIR